jgi:hypothetical protein
MLVLTRNSVVSVLSPVVIPGDFSGPESPSDGEGSSSKELSRSDEAPPPDKELLSGSFEPSSGSFEPLSGSFEPS